MRRDILAVLILIFIILIIGLIFARQSKKIKTTEDIAVQKTAPSSSKEQLAKDTQISSFEPIAPSWKKSSQNESPSPTQRANNIKEFGLSTGFVWGNLKEQDHYEVIPLMVDIGFDFKPVLNKIGLNPKGLFDINIEPFIGAIISPDKNVEFGCNFLLKYAYPLTKRFRPYIEGGFGLIYFTQQTRAQATQFNFVDQGGVGFSYLIKDNLAFNIGYRFRHISNASIKKPNSGINNDMIICGVSALY